MRKIAHYFWISLVILPVLVMSQSQVTEVTLMADDASYCKDTKGYGNDVYDDLGITAALYNGYTYVFNFIQSYGNDWDPDRLVKTSGSPRVWMFVNDSLRPMDVKGSHGSMKEDYWRSCITYFGYPSEKDYCPGLLTKVFTFQFNGRLWYVQVIGSDGDKNYYECFAQMPVQDHYECETYYTSTAVPSDKYVWSKVGAFQMDTCLYFLSQYMKYKDFSTMTPTWRLEKFYWDASAERFIHVTNYTLNIPNGFMLAGLSRRYDPATDSDYMLVSTFNTTKTYLYFLKTGDGTPSVTQVGSLSTPTMKGGVTVMPGSFQANRGIDNYQVAGQGYSDRISVLYYYNYQYGSSYPLYVWECAFTSSNSFLEISAYQINNPFGGSPKSMNSRFSITGTYTLTPHHYTNLISTSSSYYDGYQQKIWLIFPNTSQKLYGVGLNSDIWQPSPSLADSIFTSDLSIDTGTVAKEIQSLYTLMGIVDGPPPCSVDWEKWNEAYPPGTSMEKEPTQLRLSASSSQKIEFTNVVSGEFTEAASIKVPMEWEVMGVPVSTDFGVGAKFSQAYQVMNSTSKETTYSQTTGFPLSEVLQEYGSYIFAIPTITRYVFRRYAWYDGASYYNYKYPVPNSLQYLFRTTGMRYIAKPIPVSEYPFRVAEPNGTGLTDWKLGTSYGRRAMTNTLNMYPEKSKLTSSSWLAPGPPVNGSFESLVDTTVTTEGECSFEFKVTAEVKVPKIFEIKGSISYNISYSNEVSTSSTIGNDIELEINLSPEDANYINNPHSLYLDLYLFSNQDGIPYWYWDSLPSPDQQPWYIAYVVASATKQILLNTPGDHDAYDQAGTLFNWRAEDMADATFHLVIATSWPASPANVVYSESTGTETSATPFGFLPEPGKTYYWAVRGTDPSGAIVWSSPRSFMIPGEEIQEDPESSVKAVFYPNPGNGQHLSLSVQSACSGEFLVTLMTSSGTKVWAEKIHYTGPEAMIFRLPDLDLASGVYLAEIITGRERVTKKVIVIR